MKTLLITFALTALCSGLVNGQPSVPANKRAPAKVAPAKTPLLDVSKPNEFPQRKPGLWEIRTTSSQASGLPAAMFCVGEGTDHQMEHLDRTFGEKGACRISPFRLVGTAWMSESVCREGKNIVSSRSIVSGDLQTDYRIDTETSYTLTTSARREEREALAAKFINPCPANMRAGDLLISGMGKINMNDGTVVAAKASAKKRKPARGS